MSILGDCYFQFFEGPGSRAPFQTHLIFPTRVLYLHENLTVFYTRSNELHPYLVSHCALLKE